MKRLLIALVLVVMSKAAEPSTDDLIAKVRSVLSAPDHWVDMSAELRELGVLADQCGAKNKGAVITFRDGLAEYRAYFAEHPFTLSSAERRALMAAIRAYEGKIAQERDRILALWQKHPDQDRGRVDAATRALTVADDELERLSAILAPHNSGAAHPNELAAAVIGVVRRYGLFLALATESSPSVTKDQETITLSPFVDTFDWRPYHLTKAMPDSEDGYFRLIAVSRSGDVTLRDLTSGKSILIKHDQTAKDISRSEQPMRVTGFDFASQTADFEWLTTK